MSWAEAFVLAVVAICLTTVIVKLIDVRTGTFALPDDDDDSDPTPLQVLRDGPNRQ